MEGQEVEDEYEDEEDIPPPEEGETEAEYQKRLDEELALRGQRIVRAFLWVLAAMVSIVVSFICTSLACSASVSYKVHWYLIGGGLFFALVTVVCLVQSYGKD